MAACSDRHFRANPANSPSTQTILQNQPILTCKLHQRFFNVLRCRRINAEIAATSIQVLWLRLDPISDVQFAARRIRHPIQVCSCEHPNPSLFHRLHAEAIHRKAFGILVVSGDFRDGLYDGR